MWKEQYRLGVGVIDAQHKAIFEMVDQLLSVIADDLGPEEKKQACKEAVAFMKSYVIMHFNAEETYQQSINYEGLQQHQKMHRDFTAQILQQEKRLLDTDFAMDGVNHFAGMLLAWLVNHVAGADQQICRGSVKPPSGDKLTIVECFLRSLSATLERMVNIDPRQLSGTNMGKDELVGDLFVTVGIIGDLQGSVTYGFSKTFAMNVVSCMASVYIDQINDLVCSAMSEMSNIMSGSTTIMMIGKGYSCDITTPKLVTDRTLVNAAELSTKLKIATPMGELMIGTTSLY